MSRRPLLLAVITPTFLLLAVAPAFACGGLVGPRGAVNLLRTSTFAGYHRGVEHYVTAFAFAGTGGGKFGSLVPLPGIPSKIERGGDWTLQRLQREVEPVGVGTSAGSGDARTVALQGARVVMTERIDALDITVLEGGADGVAQWATEHGFELSPDAPEVLEFYARRSPIIAAAIFDGAAAERRGQQAGDGTPVHFTIPTPNPWVPLRILGLGKEPIERVEADVFLLTDRRPALLAGALLGDGLTVGRSEKASDELMTDLRSDEGMTWLPERGMWLTFLRLDARAADVRTDLAIDASGAGLPSPVAAGLTALGESAPAFSDWWPAVFVVVVAAALVFASRRRPAVT